MALSVLRGSTPIDLDELRVQLATLLRLENVSVLLGAGASVGAGGQTVRQLWNQFVDLHNASAQALVNWQFVQASDIDPNPATRTVPQIERLGDALEIAYLEWMRMAPANPANAQLAQAVSDLKRSVVRASLLQPNFWSNPEDALSNAALSTHKGLLHKLIGSRQPGQGAPWIFTTNYDLAVEWAAEAVGLQVINGFAGLHRRIFSPQMFDLGFRNVLARGEARFGTYNVYLAKLHGSLTWSEEQNTIFEHAATACIHELRDFVNGGVELRRKMVFPRAAKYMETVGFVLGELLRRFSEMLARPQTAILIAGYGFGDEHINRILLSALQNPTLQVVAYLPELDINNIGNNAKAVQALMSMRSSRITLVGGQPEAYFDQFVSHLPDPVIFDESSQRLREVLRDQQGVM
jgi:hypothetical protein